VASINLNTGGMRRGSISGPVERIVSHLPGVSAVESDHDKGRTRLEYDPSVISVERIVEALQSGGYVLGRDWFAS
jgi:copper chaperone CopZ